ncbi:type II secretion system F family protein [Tautonia rosea]|uniref:type II secretion system F family protein n=1 Tax=Tautonia rosea TaxID=2728037 RepID=UPI0014737D12|nr:type II secretion system F family protein [Tautonia rosea]
MTDPRSDPLDPDSPATRKPLSGREAAELAEAVSGLVGAGIALPEGLRALADESESARVQRSLSRLAERIDQGASLGEAVTAERDHMPAHLPGIVIAAERSGRPQELLLEAIRFERIHHELARHLLIRLAYPTILLCAFAIVFQVIARFVTLDLVAVYEDFGVRLPALTETLIQLSRWINSVGWALPMGTLLMILLVWRFAQGAGLRGGKRIANGIPLFGRIWRNAAMSEFSGLLAILLEGRLTMPEALLLAARGVCDPDLMSACLGASHEVEQGRSLLDAARQYRLFPTGFDRLLTWAETHQVLPDALRLASDIYLARARSQTTLLGVFLSAAVVGFVLIGVILIVLGLYLPSLKLLSALTGGPFSALW